MRVLRTACLLAPLLAASVATAQNAQPSTPAAPPPSAFARRTQQLRQTVNGWLHRGKTAPAAAPAQTPAPQAAPPQQAPLSAQTPAAQAAKPSAGQPLSRPVPTLTAATTPAPAKPAGAESSAKKPLRRAAIRRRVARQPYVRPSAPCASSMVAGVATNPAAGHMPPASGEVHTGVALRYQDLQPGNGQAAQPGWDYQVNYTGWLASSGTKFSSSSEDGKPLEFVQGTHRVIPGWEDGFAGMRVGGRRRIYVPWQMAYGNKSHGNIPPQADLIFDVELVSVRNPNAPPTPPAPPEAPAPPTPPTPSAPAAPPQ